MSLWNSIMANTVGVLWRAKEGTVDPWTNANQQQELAENIRRAKGPAVQKAFETPTEAEQRHDREVQQAVAQAQAERDKVLEVQGALPTQPGKWGWFSDLSEAFSGEGGKLKFYASALIAIGALGMLGYFVLQVTRLVRGK